MINHFVQWCERHYTAQSRWHFIFTMVVWSFLLKIITLIPIGFLTTGDYQTTTDVGLQEGIAILVMGAIVIGPAVETLLGQWFFIWLTGRFTQRVNHLIFWPTILFAALHVYAGFMNFFIILGPALIFTLSFWVCWKRAFWTAFWVTTVIHMIHNGIALSLYFLLAETTQPHIETFSSLPI
ncbi:hypothetical protein GF373_17085 [bacterium]|nr:hypothetical protein [bacterium]